MQKMCFHIHNLKSNTLLTNQIQRLVVIIQGAGIIILGTINFVIGVRFDTFLQLPF